MLHSRVTKTSRTASRARIASRIFTQSRLLKLLAFRLGQRKAQILFFRFETELELCEQEHTPTKNSEKKLPGTAQGLVIRKPMNTNLRLKVNHSFHLTH